MDGIWYYVYMRWILIVFFFLLSNPLFAGQGIPPKTLLKEGVRNYIVVDIRDLKSYEEARIPGAIHIPLETLKNTHKVVTSKANILLYGREDEVREGLKILKERGIDAFFIEGGIEGWIGAGGKIVEGPEYIKGLPHHFIIPRGLCETLPPAEVYDY